MLHISKLNQNARLLHKTMTFPAGECGVKLETTNLFYRETFSSYQTIWARIQNSADLMELIMVTDALRRFDPTPIHLVLSYLPYARQDRVCVSGEAFSLKVFGDLINAQNYAKVTIFDPHSDVSGAVLDRVTIIPQTKIIGQFDALNARLLTPNPATGELPIFISPDAGANKRVADLAAVYGRDSFLRADKLRDLATGKIKEILVVNPREEVEGRDCIVTDDLGDRMGTFIGLAKALKAKGARSVEIYVTHLLLTAPLDTILNPLFEAGVSRVWGTNSYRVDLSDIRLTVLNLEETFRL